MDTVVKSSQDGGKTWSPMKTIYSASCNNRDHGTPVYDHVRNRVVLVLRGEHDKTFTLHSDDDGVTWSKAVPVPLGLYSKSRPSPGRGLQLTSKAHLGRLVFVAQVGVKGTSFDVVYFTDDGGATWQQSSSIIRPGNEAQIVELTNKTLLMNARVETKDDKEARLFVTSTDGGASWSKGVLRHDLPGAGCFGSFLGVPDAKGGQTLLYAHPSNTATRADGMVFTSEDEGATFQPSYPVPDTHDGFAYSCLSTTHKPDVFGLAYETN